MNRQASSAKTSLIVLHLAHAHTGNRSKGREGLEEGNRERITIQQRQRRWLDGSIEKRQGEKNEEKGLREEEESDKEKDTR